MREIRFFLLFILCFSVINYTRLYPNIVSEFPGFVSTNYTYDSFKTEENPLRGFFPYKDEYDSFPHSLEFFYIPLKYLMNDFESYTFNSYLESWLNEIVSRNHQAIFRVYLDHPDEPTGIPDFLLNGLITYEYDEFGGGISPDYTNETLISTLEDFITELGENYDGDIRIGFIQIGLLGHWGEWHTYPHDEWFPNDIIQNRILYAFDKAFNITKIVVRYPTADSPLLDIGYHDDSFAYETIGSEPWEFYNRLITFDETEKWLTQPIGGEVYPNIQRDLWDDHPPNDVQDFTTCVNLTHVSWLLNQDQFDAYFNNKKMQRAREAALTMGYQFYIKNANAVIVNSSLEIDLIMLNTGNAPFYYPLNLKAGIDGNYSEIENYIMEIKNIILLPDNQAIYSFKLPTTELTNTSKISFKLESNHVNKPIFFANSEVNSDGSLDLRPKITSTEEISLKIIIIIGINFSIFTFIIKKRNIDKK